MRHTLLYKQTNRRRILRLLFMSSSFYVLNKHLLGYCSVGLSGALGGTYMLFNVCLIPPLQWHLNETIKFECSVLLAHPNGQVMVTSWFQMQETVFSDLLNSKWICSLLDCVSFIILPKNHLPKSTLGQTKTEKLRILYMKWYISATYLYYAITSTPNVLIVRGFAFSVTRQVLSLYLAFQLHFLLMPKQHAYDFEWC